MLRNIVVNRLLLWLLNQHVSWRHLRLLSNVLILLLLILRLSVLRLLNILRSERELWWGISLSANRLDSLLRADVWVHELHWGFMLILVPLHDL